VDVHVHQIIRRASPDHDIPLLTGNSMPFALETFRIEASTQDDSIHLILEYVPSATTVELHVYPPIQSESTMAQIASGKLLPCVEYLTFACDDRDVSSSIEMLTLRQSNATRALDAGKSTVSKLKSVRLQCSFGSTKDDEVLYLGDIDFYVSEDWVEWCYTIAEVV
jgi:hypothetical protein